MTFKELNIIQPILKAIEEKGYNRPTPIQQQAIPVALSRKDILGCAQTGTRKNGFVRYSYHPAFTGRSDYNETQGSQSFDTDADPRTGLTNQ